MPDDVPMTRAQRKGHLFGVEYLSRGDGHYIELIVYLNMELFLLQFVNPINNIDLSLEHQSSISTYRLQEEILG